MFTKIIIELKDQIARSNLTRPTSLIVVGLSALLVLQFIVVLAVLNDRSIRLQKHKLMVDDCTPGGVLSDYPRARPSGECLLTPIGFQQKV